MAKRRLLVAVLGAFTAVTASADMVNLSPDAVNRIVYLYPTTHYNDLFSTYNGGGYPQRTLVATSTASFVAALSSVLGPLGADQQYQINSAMLKVGASIDDYATVGLAEAYEVIVSYDTNTVTWSSFGNGGAAGVQYALTPAATGIVSAPSTSWNLTSVVQGWVNGAANNGLFFPDYPPRQVLNSF